MNLIIIGAGGHGITVSDIVSQSKKYEKIIFLDDKAVVAKSCCKDFFKYVNVNNEFYVAFGNNELRQKWVDRILESGGKQATIVHERAYISPKAALGRGTIVFPNAIVNTNTIVGDGCIINCGAIVDHDCVIGDGSHIGLGAVVKSVNNIPKSTKVDALEVIPIGTFK